VTWLNSWNVPPVQTDVQEEKRRAFGRKWWWKGEIVGTRGGGVSIDPFSGKSSLVKKKKGFGRGKKKGGRGEGRAFGISISVEKKEGTFKERGGGKQDIGGGGSRLGPGSAQCQLQLERSSQWGREKDSRLRIPEGENGFEKKNI